MEVERFRAFGIEVADKPGALQSVLEKVAAGGVDLCCFYAASIGGGKGKAYICAKKPQTLETIASATDLKFEEEAVGVMIDDEDKVGAAAQVLKKLADANINCLGGAARVCDGKYHMGIVVAAEDGDAAEKALK